jgi:ribosome-binding factor A
MQATRRARLGAVIQEELSVVIRGLKDPRVEPLTVTAVELTPDAGLATIFVQILGGRHSDDENAEKEYRRKMRETLQGLASASGFLRRHLASVLTVRHIPQLVFKEDKGLENASRVYDLLKKIEGEGGGSP